MSADDEPKITAIVGESGSGKTTLTRLLLGFLRPTSRDPFATRAPNFDAMTAAERMAFRREVQAIFQDPFEVYNPFYKVDRVLMTPLRKFGSPTPGPMPTADRAGASTVGLRPRGDARALSASALAAGSASAS